MTTATAGSNALAAAAAVAAVARSESAEADRRGVFAAESLEAIRSTGLLATFAQDDIGAAGIPVAYSAVARVLGRASASVALIWVMHSQQVLTIRRYAADELRDRVFDSVRRGANYIGSVTTETSTGGDLHTSDVAPVPDGERIAIRRHAPVVTGGCFADSFLIKTQSTASRSPRDTALVYADREDLTVTVGPSVDMMGMRSTGNVALDFAGSVPRANELRTPLPELLPAYFAPLAHIGWASAWLGCAEDALAKVLRWIRRGAGRRLVESDAALEDLARIRADIEVVAACLGACVRRAADDADLAGSTDQIHLNVLKTVASRHCFTAVDRMVRLVGWDEGYLRDSELGLERSLRDLRAAELMFHDRRLRRSTGALLLQTPDAALMG
ncbi:acyl-CoA dehydrogenase family protein [Nocardia sp. R6R-6]|uniref:acyl-CoA dehydrogenase family protein n=1 Tax=Nocardia sp. R6R-6 TaxID=3459303 RepID=UPI00403DAD86